MSPGSRRVIGVLGWVVAAAIVVAHLAGKYDVSVRERAIGTGSPGVAVTARPDPGGAAPVADDLLRALVGEAQAASGRDLLVVDRKLAAAEQQLPSDYRFTYARAKLAVYGRDEHHEAFHHLKRAAEKAIRTRRAAEMLQWLEADGAPHGALRKLAVGHREWAQLEAALTRGDGHRLWRASAPAHDPVERHAGTAEPAPESPHEDAHSARTTALSLLELGKPCQALVALRPVRDDPETEHLYHSAREDCLR